MEIAEKDLLPTTMGTEEIRATYSRGILERSFFSARVFEARTLANFRDTCQAFADGTINEAECRELMLRHLDAIGYSSEGRGLQNLASRKRLELVLETQRKMAASAAQAAADTPATLMMYPAWRLERYEGRSLPRQDWMRRWAAAGLACGFQGACRNEMVALKNSPIWERLGAGAGGFRDAVGNPYPPFAFGSGLAWTDVPAEEAEALGLDVSGTGPADANLSPGEDEIRRALEGLDGFDVSVTAE